MGERSRTSRLGRGRAALLWALGLFLFAQLGLNVALVCSWPLRDPEYGHRLVALHQRLSERGAGRPLVLLLGSSRVAMNVRPGLMEANRRDAPGPIVFNFGMCRGGPMLESLCLRRLLADGVRPELVLAELHWILLGRAFGEHDELSVERLSWSDVQTFASEYERPGRLRRHWLRAHAVPWYSLNTHLLTQWMPTLLDDEGRRKRNEWRSDGWGWLEVPEFREDDPAMTLGLRRVFCERNVSKIKDGKLGFEVSDHSRRMLGDLADLCRRENIRLGFLLMPDMFMPRYNAASCRRVDDAFTRLSRECGVPVIDLRDQAVIDDFVDGTHMTDAGAARFTRLFESELLPYLEGEPLDRRWRPGEVRPTEQAQRGLAEREAGTRRQARSR